MAGLKKRERQHAMPRGTDGVGHDTRQADFEREKLRSNLVVFFSGTNPVSEYSRYVFSRPIAISEYSCYVC